MSRDFVKCALASAAMIFISNAVHAESAPGALRRVAVIVGANKGALGRSDLRYSYRDAQSIADALVQVGRFAPEDVQVLLDPQPDAVLAALDEELKTLAALPGESLLFFYYSGHADGGALYPAGKPLSFKSVHDRLESTAATVRVGVIDTCSGGGWTGAKGMHQTEPFAIEVPLALSGEGSVLIASSSGVESAHESEQLLGSYFTHHFVAALRGAAAPHGDGVVTLNDAFAYARERTVRDSAAAAPEPQHPSFSMNLHGRADLAMARADSSPTAIDVEQSDGPLQLIDLATGVVLLEAPAGKRSLKLSVPPGRYLVRRQGEHGNFTRAVTLEAGGTATVREEDLTLSAFNPTGGKGVSDAREPAEPPDFWAPNPDRGLTPAGSPMVAFLAGLSTVQSFLGFTAAPLHDGTLYDGTLRLGWVFPALPIAAHFQPSFSIFVEGRFGAINWQNSESSAFERALGIRAQANLIRTHYFDLYLNVGFGRETEDSPGAGAFSSTWRACQNPDVLPTGCGLSEVRVSAGVEAHLTDLVHIAFEPDAGVWGGNNRIAWKLGLVFR